MVISDNSELNQEKNIIACGERLVAAKAGALDSGVFSPFSPESGAFYVNEKGHKVLNRPLVPLGLVKVINNYHDDHKMMTSLYYGLEDERDVQANFVKMESRVTGSGVVYRDRETGEVKDGKSKSRWNSDYDYGGSVYHRLVDEAAGLKHCCMVTLTYDQNLLKQLMPDWWVLGIKEFAILFTGFFESNFVKQVTMHQKRQGRPATYLGSVLEFHLERGLNQYLLHVHVIFAGKWVASTDKLHQFWGISQYQGVDVKLLSGRSAVGYISKYVTKNLELFRENKEMKQLAKWFWFFRRRLFNIRHKKAGHVGLGFSRRLYEKKACDLIGYSYRGKVFEIKQAKLDYKRKMRELKKDAHWIEYEDDE